MWTEELGCQARLPCKGKDGGTKPDGEAEALAGSDCPHEDPTAAWDFSEATGGPPTPAGGCLLLIGGPGEDSAGR